MLTLPSRPSTFRQHFYVPDRYGQFDHYSAGSTILEVSNLCLHAILSSLITLAVRYPVHVRPHRPIAHAQIHLKSLSRQSTYSGGPLRHPSLIWGRNCGVQMQKPMISVISVLYCHTLFLTGLSPFHHLFSILYAEKKHTVILSPPPLVSLREATPL